MGIAVIFPILGKWMLHLTRPLTIPGRHMMEILMPSKKIEFYGGEVVCEVQRIIYRFVLIVMLCACRFVLS